MKNKDNLFLKRTVSSLVVVFFVYVFPWQVSLIFLVLASAINKNYLEVVILGTIMDAVYTSYIFGDYPIPFLTFSILIYWIMSFLQTRVFHFEI